MYTYSTSVQPICYRINRMQQEQPGCACAVNVSASPAAAAAAATD